jgi:hypothetical protein
MTLISDESVDLRQVRFIRYGEHVIADRAFNEANLWRARYRCKGEGGAYGVHEVVSAIRSVQWLATLATALLYTAPGHFICRNGY